uniref:DNA-directed RNA polymerase n=1 Tax=Pediastrum duplex TaxID=3105 RepID=A0A2U8GI09_PEDDU|nr:RNA polymerase beta subunit [Pediastrum duplex]
MPWEGYNYEDAILISERLVCEDLYTSIHIESYETETRKTKYGFEEITNRIPDISLRAREEISYLDNRGIIRIGTFVQEGTILVGKTTPIQKKFKSPYQKLLYTILEKELESVKDSSLRAPKGLKAKVIDIKILKKNIFKKPEYVKIYLAEKRKIQVGDKMAGRHGNKGIVSQILPRQDMPYLPDGTPLDMVLNPLGVPSRMNVGQIYECLLGFASKYLKEYFRITPFDEIYGAQASRSFVFSKLYEARLKTKKKWIFNPIYPGKIKLFDGRTGEPFDQAVTVGISYMLKLVHLVDDKIHARSTGPYSLVTQQPLRGRSKYGGQRLGEMEVWALEGYGAAFTLLEMLTIKSDDITGRMTLWSNILLHKEIYIGTPESFKVLVCELQALCLDIGLYRLNQAGFFKKVENLIRLP